MANEIIVTVTGNLTGDPELRYTPSGVAVANFTVASTPRVQKDGEWTDGDPTFLRCQVWRAPAEIANDCLRKGFRVIVTGKLQQRAWEDREGQKHTTMELLVDEIGGSIKFAHWAKVDPKASQELVKAKTAGKTKNPPKRSPHDPIEDEPPF